MELVTGQTAVVTGGGSGIGREIALAFAREGVNVVVTDIDQARAQSVADEVAGLGVRSLAVRTDVSDAASVEALADAAYAEFGAVNVLCNNAGVVEYGNAADASQDDWDWLFKVNLWGVVNGVRTFVPRMRAQGTPAHIVNTASMSGVFAVPGLGVYTAAKYAVMGFTETLRMELEADGIGVSVLCPGPTTPSRINETARGVNSAGDIDRLDPSEVDLTVNTAWRHASVVAKCVIDGVTANRLYLFSHVPSRPFAEARFDHMLEDYNAAP